MVQDWLEVRRSRDLGPQILHEPQPLKLPWPQLTRDAQDLGQGKRRLPLQSAGHRCLPDYISEVLCTVELGVSEDT